ncbi:biliverdin-producing heme oxygenase [Taibaiella lutea]|uniref:Biliverdin-producing heme oxygenase n=1 Tax=Taibaiella lutea TaxID=2608001 RepID=A0A5M6CCM7_9BACT|nr:biliverdin-producing heme oxygenase [Taibaiella lutea]KAA5532210.1 biliverdin-producing heme oxygenase [Taibaiella lutea]
MLSEELKSKTATNHQQLEKKMIYSIRMMRDANDYASLLQLFYSYFGGLEHLIKLHINTDILPDYAKRRKADQLASDLLALSAPVPSLAEAEYLPEITNDAQALGATYVIEGSTLGGQIIKKILGKQLGIDDDRVISFFNGYGENTNSMWDNFKNAIDKNSDIETYETVIAAANETFQKLSEWFDIHYEFIK